MRILLLCVACCLCWSTAVFADVATAVVTWAYNGTNDTGGFYLYKQAPNSTEWEMIQDIPDVTTRSWTGDVTVDEGRQYFAFSAYDGEGNESNKTSPTPFEYMVPTTPGLPVPTVIIKFN